MVKCVLPLLLVLLTGCASAPPLEPLVMPQIVKVPVAQPIYCPAPKITRPARPVAELRRGTAPADTMGQMSFAFFSVVLALLGIVARAALTRSVFHRRARVARKP
jgi:hypothetical protein